MKMNEELLAVLEHIERERGIDKEILFKAIESALVSAAKKIVSDKEAEVSVSIDRATGEINITSGGKSITSGEFGRIAAQTAKQVIIQKIREAEKEVVLDDYQKRIGTITDGSVHRFERGDIILDLGKTEAILPRSQQCPKEHYKQGDRIRAYILEVEKTAHGARIILSRSSADFVKKLFELEVPEITENIVEIRSISREAGERTKIAVSSKDEKIDPVGACVGMRGTRVKDIVRELQGEKIDIIKWSDDIKEYVRAAMSPAEISDIIVDKAAKKVEIAVKDDQLSVAIGRHGQNVRLASRLTGWEIDVRGSKKREAAQAAAAALEAAAPQEGPSEVEVPLTELDGVGEKTAKVLKAAGYDTVAKIKALSIDDLTKLDGIGKKTAEKILNSAKKY
jgi:N utilization substance protein A